MGIFKKEYTFSDAVQKISADRDNKYTTIPLSNGKYLVVKSDEAEKIINKQKLRKGTRDIITRKVVSTYKQRKQDFQNEINGNGAYQNAQKVPQYNNYQATKGYRNSLTEIDR